LIKLIRCSLTKANNFPKRFQDRSSLGGTLTLDLDSYTEFSVGLNFFDGIKNIRPSDRKRLVNFSVQNPRKGLKENPDTLGRAIELGGLYVGREQELDKIVFRSDSRKYRGFSGMGLLTFL
jgi:hypothetical protein